MVLNWSLRCWNLYNDDSASSLFGVGRSNCKLDISLFILVFFLNINWVFTQNKFRLYKKTLFEAFKGPSFLQILPFSFFLFFLNEFWLFQRAYYFFPLWTPRCLVSLSSYLAEPTSFRGEICMHWIKLSASNGRITGVSISLKWNFPKVNCWILRSNCVDRRWFLSTRVLGCYGNVNSARRSQYSTSDAKGRCLAELSTPVDNCSHLAIVRYR